MEVGCQLIQRVSDEVLCQAVVMNNSMMQEIALLYFNEGGLFLERSDVSLQAHLQKDILCALKGGLRMQKWIAQAGIAGDTGKCSRLGNVELGGGGSRWGIL